MNKEEFDELYVGENVAVYCPTEELTSEFLGLADIFGYTLTDGSRYVGYDLWCIHKENTTYCLSEGMVAHKDYYECHNYKVVEFKSSKEEDLLQLVWERKEFKVSEDEKSILRNAGGEFRFIARNMSGNLFLFNLLPHKNYNYNVWHRYEDLLGAGKVIDFSVYKHLFQYVKWEDEKPTLIDDLINS